MKSVSNYVFALAVFSFANAIGNVGMSQAATNNSAQPIPRVLTATKDGEVKAFSLNGYWAGVAYLDMDKLQEKLAATTDVDLQKSISLQAEMFLSMVSVVNFKPNGMVESELELNDENGKIVTEATTGSWKIVESRESKFLVDVLERHADGSTVTVRKMFQFYEDGEHMASHVETSPELADLNPLLIFERIPAALMAERETQAEPKRDR
jgi:hypothetical protein